MTCPQCRQHTTRNDLRRLYFNINLNTSRLDLNSTASIIEMLEKERTNSKMKKEAKKHLERVSFDWFSFWQYNYGWFC